MAYFPFRVPIEQHSHANPFMLNASAIPHAVRTQDMKCCQASAGQCVRQSCLWPRVATVLQSPCVWLYFSETNTPTMQQDRGCGLLREARNRCSSMSRLASIHHQPKPHPHHPPHRPSLASLIHHQLPASATIPHQLGESHNESKARTLPSSPLPPCPVIKP
eukprot:1158937-Pelagomonas_calceolata.AAC.3